MTNTDPLDLNNFRLDPEALPERRAVAPRKMKKRREHFVRVPWTWVEALSGATGQTWHLAMHLLYLHWKGNGAPIKLANGMLKIDGISRASKWRALAELERRGLITVERRPSRSPIIGLTRRILEAGLRFTSEAGFCQTCLNPEADDI